MELKAYTWEPEKDSDSGSIAIIAGNWREARKLGYDAWGREQGHDAEFIDQRCRQYKDKDLDISGLPKGMVDGPEGLKRGLYGWIYADCDRCDEFKTISQVILSTNEIICDECDEKQRENIKNV